LGAFGGLITGVVLSLAYKTPEYKKPTKYDWEKPDFNPKKTSLCNVLTRTGILLMPLKRRRRLYRNSKVFYVKFGC
jgi:hypothetical protein